MLDNRLTPELVVMAIESGMLDNSLSAIEATLDTRKEILNRRAAASLNTGDHFLIKDCRPKYWNGEEVEFLKRDGMWLKCKVLNPRIVERTVRIRESHVGTIMSRAGE